MRTSFLLYLLTLLLACTDSPKPEQTIVSGELIMVDTTSSAKLQFVFDGEFGEIFRSGFPPAPIPGTGPKFAVDKNGNVYLVDPYQIHIKVVSKDGQLIKEIGRDGSGPGEFRSLSGIYTQDEELVVFDGFLQRVQYFDIADFSLNRSFLFEPAEWTFEETPRMTNPVRLLPYNGNLLAGLFLEKQNERDRIGYIELDDQGNQLAANFLIEERSPLQQSGSMSSGMATSVTDPTSGQDLIQTSDSLIFKLNTREMITELYNGKGEFLRSLSLPFDRLAVERAQVLDEYHPNMHSIFDDADFPEYWPAAENFIVDDEQRIWVAGIVEDRSVNKWFVFDLTGKLTGTFRWPREETILFVKDDLLYTSFEDFEEGFKTVRRYQIGY